jgi:phosphoglycolate phosphatase
MMIPEMYPRKAPKAILFDWDNTLVDTWRVVFHSMNTALEGVNRPIITVEEFWKRPHHSMRDTAIELFGENAEKGEHLYYEAFAKSHLQNMNILEGAEALLKNLSSKGIYVGVVSNKEGPHLRKEVSHLGWDSHFRRIIGARDTKEDKPSPIPVLAALQGSTIAPSHDVWFVGDSIVDVYCARASGCVPSVVGDGEASEQHDIVHAKDCSGLLGLLTRLA